MKNRPLPLIALFILSTFFACVTDTGVVIIPSADPLDVARQYIEQDDYPRALAYLEENTDLNSPIKQWEVLANLYLTNNNLASAKDAFMTLLSLEENHAQSMAALAKIAFIEGDYATQKRLLDQAQALDPNNIDVLIALGNYHYFNENNGRARELYTKANSIEKTPIGLGNLGRIEYQEENLETADLLLTEAIRLDPAVNAQLYFKLGIWSIGTRKNTAAR
jgi:tetratricopeptide (TPR) repeat protein